MIHQELNYYPDMTVEANLYIARENTYFAGIVNRKEISGRYTVSFLNMALSLIQTRECVS